MKGTYDIVINQTYTQCKQTFHSDSAMPYNRAQRKSSMTTHHMNARTIRSRSNLGAELLLPSPLFPEPTLQVTEPPPDPLPPLEPPLPHWTTVPPVAAEPCVIVDTEV